MRNVYSVSRINAYIRRMFEEDYLLRDVLVRGEVSNCKYHASGHIYFTLKDASGTLSCVMFAGRRRGLSFPMQNGDQVIVGGSIDVYGKAGAYQLYASRIIKDGQGALAEQFERLKKKLLEQGMFDEAYKQPIPPYIRTLGVVTAATGAAVRDIVQIARRRNPFIEIILYPAIVQGDAAPDSIIRGIRTLDERGVDVIIIGRGGGSLEDLWAFNEERVAQAVFDCMTPVISAVGHETDTVITDFVADLRAPTPSAAAELAVFDLRRYDDTLENFRASLTLALHKNLRQHRLQLLRLERELHHLSPDARIRDQRMTADRAFEKLDQLMQEKIDASRRASAQEEKLTFLIREKTTQARRRLAACGNLDHNMDAVLSRDRHRISLYTGTLAPRMDTALARDRHRIDLLAGTFAPRMDTALARDRHRMQLLAGALAHLSPLARLSGGYGFVARPDGTAVHSARDLTPGDPFRVQLRDGRIDATVDTVST